MWIDRKVYENLLLDNAKLREESRVLNDRVTAQQAALEWFMIRVTQLEKERAALVHNYMGVKLETPDFRPRVVAQNLPENIPDTIGSMSFADIGDEAAKRLGLGWDESGAVTRHQ